MFNSDLSLSQPEDSLNAERELMNKIKNSFRINCD